MLINLLQIPGLTMASVELCCCVLCGLPASGKTTLSELIVELVTLQTTLRSNTRTGVVHVCYDSIIPQLDHGFLHTGDEELSSASSSHTVKQSVWKEYRRQIVECVDAVFRELREKKSTLSETITLLQNGNNEKDSEERVGTSKPDSVIIRGEVRRKVAKCLSETAERIGGESCSRFLFLIDDNMFYRSMRYECFQLARKHSIGYCQIGLLCTTKSAVARNCGRSDPIPEETVLTMATKLEIPDASKAPWEKNTILIDAENDIDHSVLGPIWVLIQTAFQNPIPALQEQDEETKEQSRAECAANVLHQSDQALRKVVSEIMLASKDSLTKEKMKELAAVTNAAKTALLDEVRGGCLVPPPLPLLGPESAPREEFEAFFRDCLVNRVPIGK